MKASIGLRTRDASFTAGTAGRTGFLKDHHVGAGRVLGSGCPLCAAVDPVADGVDFRRGERALAGRHLQFALAAHRFVEQALVGLAGDDGGTALAALQDGVAVAQVEIGHARGAVAGGAFGFEDGPGSFLGRIRLCEQYCQRTAPARSGVTDAFLPLRPFEMPWTLYFVERVCARMRALAG